MQHMANLNIANQISNLKNLSGSESKQKANEFFHRLELAVNGLSEPEKISYLGSKCADRALIIFNDGKKAIHPYTFESIKFYMLQRLTMADIKQQTAMNALSTDIPMYPDEGIEHFAFRVRDLVSEGIPSLDDPDSLAIHYFLKNLQNINSLKFTAKTVSTTFTPGTKLDEIIRRVIAGSPNFKTLKEKIKNFGKQKFGWK